MEMQIGNQPHPGITLLHKLQGHEERIQGISWSPDGKKIASASHDKTIRIWDWETGKCTAILKGHSDKVLCIAWSPDGSIIASGSADNTIRTWDGQVFKPLLLLEGHTKSILSLVWLNNPIRIVSGSFDTTARIWDMQGAKTIKVLKKHTDIVNRISVSPDNQFIASCSDDTTIMLYDGKNGNHIKTLAGHKSYINCITWSSCGKWLASASTDKTIIILNRETWKPQHILEGHTADVFSISFSPDSSLLVSRSFDNTVRLWNTITWQEKAHFSEKVEGWFLPTPIFHPHFPNPPLLATFGEIDGEENMTILIWELDVEKITGKAFQKEKRFYRNAKIALVGDSGVGKTGLGLVLSGQKWEPTESTHGRHVWSLGKNEETISGKHTIEERELLLWDLAGQPGYRLIHRLHLHDVAVALVLFDARSETDPFAGVEYWAKAIDQATGEAAYNTVKILVAARSDRGGISVSKERLSGIMDRLGFV
ncbi:MAG: PD40 domain-containing protein, partial [Spirochaetales bacterium]|nr:PD40 domain-containing protein [Spirochaetales bacterium]